jgi:serine/threonine protein kinase
MIDINDYTDEKGRFDGRYLLIRPLSTDGATADVWLSLDLNTVSATNEQKIDEIARMSDDEIEKLGLMVAIKIYRPQNALDIEGEQRFRDEYMIVFNCHHANLIHPTNFSIYRDTPYLVLPYCKRGSSELLIGNKFSDDDIWKYIQDVASGLAYLHALEPPIVHQDVKPANVLLDDTGHYALTDFGISTQRGGVHGYYFDDENSGTMAYMAPERFQKDTEPMAQSDIWGFGATLYEILTGKVPFGEDGGLVQPEGDVTFGFKGVQISDDIKKLICACLNKNPSERPTATELVDAANQKLFRTTRKSRSLGKIIGIVCTLIAIGVGAWYLLSYQTKESRPEDLFEDALVWVNASSIDSVRTGIEKLDSLAKRNYEPAQRELAKAIGPNSLTAEKALAAFSRAENEFQSVKGNAQELYDTVAINIFQHYDKAIDWAKLAKEDSLAEKYKQNRDIFVNHVITKYDDQIMWGHYDDPQVENEFKQYKNAFLAVVEKSHY